MMSDRRGLKNSYFFPEVFFTHFFHIGNFEEQIEMLQKENAAMKEEMKKCIGGKDLSKNVTELAARMTRVEREEIERDRLVKELKGVVETSEAERRNISRSVDGIKQKEIVLDSEVDLLNRFSYFNSSK